MKKTDAGEAPLYKLSVNDLVIKAMAMALMAVPEANVTWTEGGMLKHKRADVGVAVSIPGGLITPVVRNADTKTLSQISNEMKDLAARARKRKLKPEEYQGGSTAISNLGMFGVKDFAAVINPPHATILAVGAGEERAIVEKGEIKVATHDDGDDVDRPSRRRRRARRGTASGVQTLHRGAGGDAGLAVVVPLLSLRRIPHSSQRSSAWQRSNAARKSVWKGGGPDGKGTLTTQSGALNGIPTRARHALRRRQGHQPGRAARRRACRLLQHGACLRPRRGRAQAG